MINSRFKQTRCQILVFLEFKWRGATLKICRMNSRGNQGKMRPREHENRNTSIQSDKTIPYRVTVVQIRANIFERFAQRQLCLADLPSLEQAIHFSTNSIYSSKIEDFLLNDRKISQVRTSSAANQRDCCLQSRLSRLRHFLAKCKLIHGF